MAPEQRAQAPYSDLSLPMAPVVSANDPIAVAAHPLSPGRSPRTESAPGATDTASALRRRDLIIQVLLVGAAAILAVFPWLHAFGLLETTNADWVAWIGAIGLHALALHVWPPRRRLVPGLSLATVLGLCFAQAAIVFWRLETNYLSRDFALVAGWLSALDRGPFAVMASSPYSTPFSYFQLYFDPLVPLLNRVLRLTDDPVRLLGFQLIAVLLAPIATWYICVRAAALRAFQFLLPVVFLLHPALVGPLQLDYHTSPVGLTLLTVGSYAYWRGRRRSSFVLILLGTLTKISYWPSWIMFGIVYAVRRRWAWAAIYVVVGTIALVTYTRIVPVRSGSGPIGVSGQFNYLGDSHVQIALNVIREPLVWMTPVAHPARWLFFVVMFLPFGFVAFRRPRR
jgi:Predicted membrane protein (DUF2079)